MGADVDQLQRDPEHGLAAGHRRDHGGPRRRLVFENRFVPDGSITVEKVTRGGVGTSGFLIASQSEPTRQYQQAATTVREDEPVTATGKPARPLALGTYTIQESATTSDDGRRWTLESVVCNGELRPFAQGQVTVELTAAAPGPRLPLRQRARRRRAAAARAPRPTPSPAPSPSPAPCAEPSTGVADLVITKRPLRRVSAARAARRLRDHGPQRGGSRRTTSSIVDRPRPRDRPHRERQREPAAAATTGHCCVPHRHPRTRHPRQRSRARARHHVALSGELAVVGSSTQETRLRNNLARARVRVVDVSEPARPVRLGEPGGDGRAGARSPGLALLTRRAGSSPRRAS